MQIKKYIFSETIKTNSQQYEINTYKKNIDMNWYYLNYFFQNDFHEFLKNPKLINELQANEAVYLYETFVLFDKNKNIIYIGDDTEYNRIMFESDCPDVSDLKLVQDNIIKAFPLKKENFLYLLTKWNQETKINLPYMILYQNENDWIDTKSFKTKETIEQFIKDHS